MQFSHMEFGMHESNKNTAVQILCVLGGTGDEPGDPVWRGVGML